MLLTIGKWVAAGYLVQAVIWDIRKKAVPTALIRLVLLAAVILRLAGIEKGVGFEVGDGKVFKQLFMIGGAILPGVLLLLIGYVTKEAVGYADGWSILLLGLLLGGRAAVCVMFTAFLFAAVYALWLIVGRRADRGMRFPFLPHISAGFIVWIMFFGMGV
ncbi:MAG: hypothetical protein GX234_01530 [Clostridiales bacterium]|nr:hypothetical protein [Clostridiales bacterium]